MQRLQNQVNIEEPEIETAPSSALALHQALNLKVNSEYHDRKAHWGKTQSGSAVSWVPTVALALWVNLCHGISRRKIFQLSNV